MKSKWLLLAVFAAAMLGAFLGPLAFGLGAGYSFEGRLAMAFICAAGATVGVWIGSRKFNF